MTTELKIYANEEAALATLEEMYRDTSVDLSTKNGVKECKEIARKFQKVRTGIEKLRKEANSEARAHIKNVDDHAKSIQARVAPLEEKFAAPIKMRTARIKAGIDEIDGVIDECFGKGSCFIGEKLQWLEGVNTDDFFEFAKDAKASLFTANEKLTQMFNEAVQKESEELARQEEEARHRIDSVINGMKSKVADAMDFNKSAIGRVISDVESTKIDSSFGDREQEAIQTKEKTINQLRKLHAMAEDEIKEEEQISFTLDENDEDAPMFMDSVADSKGEPDNSDDLLSHKMCEYMEGVMTLEQARYLIDMVRSHK